MNKLNFAIVGSGLMARIYALSIKSRTDCNLIAITGNTKKKVDIMAEEFQCNAYYNGNWEQMLEELDEIDTVIVTTPEWIRIDLIKCLKRILLWAPLIR